MTVYAVVDAAGAEVVRWTDGPTASEVVAPLVRDKHVELWADGVMVQRSDIGSRDPASMRFVVA